MTPPSRPRVTVLMPVRDGAATVSAAMDSILGGVFEDLELLAVDDGSTDGTMDALRAAADRDPRVRPVALGEPRGIVAALNHGLELARGELVARMDADDEALPDRLDRQVRLMDELPGVEVCDSQVEIFRDDGPPGGGFLAYQEWMNEIQSHEDFEREFCVENPVCHPAVITRGGLLQRVGGYRDGPYPEDYDIWLRCLRAGARFHKIPRRLLRWRDHGGRLTRTDDRYRRSAFFPLKWDHLAHTRLRDRPAVAVWGAGPTARPWTRALVLHGMTPRAVFDIDPVKIGRTRQGVEILPVERATDVEFDLLLIAVGARGARRLIRDHLERTDLREVRDYLFVS